MVTFKGFWCITAKKCYIYSAVSYLEKKSAEFKEKVMHSEEVLMNSNIKKKGVGAKWRYGCVMYMMMSQKG